MIAERRLITNALPVGMVLLVALVLWYLLALALNAPGVIDRVLAPRGAWNYHDVMQAALNASRPLLPAPHQIAIDIWNSITQWPLTSPRNLLLHTWVTASAALTGFAMGVVLGVVLAVCIVHSRTLDKALLPWIVASQTIPVLAIAPIVLIILGSVGITGMLPKATIAMYLCFFPVTIRHRAGTALAAKNGDGTDAHLGCPAGRYLLDSAPALFAAVSVSGVSRGNCQRTGRHDGGRTAHRGTGRAGRATADRLLLWQHHSDLVGAGNGLAAWAGVNRAGHAHGTAGDAPA